MLRFIYCIALVLLLSVGPSAAEHFDHSYKIGILAFQPKAETSQKWSILGRYLQQEIPGFSFNIIPLSETELESAVRTHQVDFVLTNPEQYIRFYHFYGLSAPLLTVVRGNDKLPLRSFGGSILTRADSPIKTLEDLAGRKVAVPFKAAFGACKAQQFELYKKNLPLIPPEQMIETGLPHDNIVMAVLEGKAEIGFARAGTLERMASQGKIQLAQFKVINQQPMGDFPVQISTSLYPEWPLAALTHIDLHTQGKVIAALLNMRENGVGNLPFNVLEFIPPADYHSVEEVMQVLRIPPFDQTPEFRLIDVWTRYQKTLIVAAVAALTFMLLGFYLYLSRKKLAASHVRLQEILNSIDANIYVADMESYQILFVNQHMINGFGRDLTGELCWKTIWAESAPCSHCNNDNLIDDKGQPVGVCSWEAVLPNGHHHLLHDRAIRWVDGRLVRMQIGTDISAVKRMEEELRQKSKMEALGIMASGVSHHFNNSMAVILGNIELAQMQKNNEAAVTECLANAKTALLRSRDMARQVLTYSRGKFNQKENLCLSDFLKQTSDLIQAAVPKNTRLTERIAIGGDKSTIYADPTDIQSVLLGLCNNAVQAMNGRGTLTIGLDWKNLSSSDTQTTYSCRPGPYVCLSISDTGCGMSEKTIEKIFDPFFTTRDIGQGTGLGLSSVQGVVQNHGGMIKVRSAPGQGSTFELFFPCVE